MAFRLAPRVPWLVTSEAQGLLLQAVRAVLALRLASAGSRHHLGALRLPLVPAVPAPMHFFYISRLVRADARRMLMLASCRDACAQLDVAPLCHSCPRCSISAAGRCTGDERRCRSARARRGWCSSAAPRAPLCGTRGLRGGRRACCGRRPRARPSWTARAPAPRRRMGTRRNQMVARHVVCDGRGV